MPGTTGGITAIQQNLFYIGAAKQNQWGTAVPATWFWRWLDGTDANPVPKFGQEREGDTSPYISLVWKQGQWWEIKIVEYVRPILAGYALQALLGTGSDAYTAPATSTTFAAPVAAGATSFESAVSLGNAGTAYFNFTPGYSSAVYEVLNINLASQTGTGPYTYNLVAGQKFKYPHAQNDAITTTSVHTLTRQPLTYDAYSFDLGYGLAAGGLSQAIRVQDAVCVELDVDSETKKPLKFTHTWYGTLSTLDAALAVASFEGNNIIGAAGGPLRHEQAQSNWLVDGVATGNAATIKKFSLKLKNGTAPDDFQSEGINPAYFTMGTFDVTGQLDVIFQNFSQYMEMYYGSASPAVGAQDSYLTGFGAIQTKYASDAINALQLALPNVAYTAGKLTPKLDGKPLPQSITFTASKDTPSRVPFTATLSNSNAASY